MQMGLSEPRFFTENLGKVVRLGNIADKGATLFYNEKYGGHKALHTHAFLFVRDV